MTWPQTRNQRRPKGVPWLCLAACLAVSAAVVFPMLSAGQGLPLRMIGIAPSNRTNVVLRWEGGIGPYRIQMTTNGGATWFDRSPEIYSNSYVVPIDVRASGSVLFRVRTMPDTAPPPPPSSVFGVAPSCREVRVAWWPVSDVGPSGLWGYRLYKDGALVAAIPGSNTLYVDTNCLPASQYAYAVSALDNAGNESPPSAPANTATPLCANLAPSLAGFLPGLGVTHDVVARGDTVFLASDAYGLSVANVSNPAAPQVLGSANVPFHGTALDVAGNLACVTGHRTVDDGGPVFANAFGLYVLDVSATTPVLRGSIESAGGVCYGVALAGSRAYVACGSDGVRVADLRDPAQPRFVGSFDTPGFANAICLTGAVAFVADGAAGLRILSLANPDAPVSAGMIDTPGSARDVAVAGGLAYVADDTSLRIFDVSNPAAPIARGALAISAQRIKVRNGLAYVGASSRGLLIVNVSNPANPILVGSLSPAGNPNASTLGVALSGNLACLANREGGLVLADISAPVAPVVCGTRMDWFQGYKLSARPGLALVTGTAYSDGGALATNGLRVIDLSNPASPVVAGQLDAPTLSLYGVALTNQLAFVACGAAGLRVVDVTSPSQPRFIGSYDTPGFAQAVCVSGNYAYVADGAAGLRILNVSVPTAPVNAGSIDTPGTAKDVAVVGNLAYVADGTTLQIFDVSNPSAPVARGSYPVAAMEVKVMSGHAYVAAASAGLIVLNVSNPAAITLAGSLAPAGHVNASTLGVALAGSTAFVANREGGLALIDVSTPAAPVLRHILPLLGNGSGVAAAGSWVMLSDSLATLDSVRLSP